MRLILDTTDAEMQERRYDGNNIVASWYTPEHGYCVAVWNRARKQWQTISPFYRSLPMFNRHAGNRYGVRVLLPRDQITPKLRPSTFYFARHETVYVDMVFDAPHRGIKAGLRFDLDGGVRLVSYTKEVLYISPEGWLTVTPRIMRNENRDKVLKHIAIFLEQFIPNVSVETVEQCYISKNFVNIYTGEQRRC